MKHLDDDDDYDNDGNGDANDGGDDEMMTTIACRVDEDDHR